MGKVFTFLGVVLAASAISAIVAATVVTDYVPEIYQRRFHAGEVDWIITVESEVLRETRDLRVKVPEDYDADPDRRYPVLLVLDGEWQLDHTDGASSTLELLDLGEPMIVVGGPTSNPLAGSAQEQGLVKFAGLKPDGFVLKTVSLAGRPAVLVGGNEEAATMYAASELLERLGIVFQLTNDIIPQ